MTLLLGAVAIAVIGGGYFWRSRARPGRAQLFDPPHTPPTVPWAGRDPDRLAER